MFFLRQGVEPRGIFGSGIVTKGSYPDAYWRETSKTRTKTAWYVKVQLDTLLNPEGDIILPRGALDEPALSGANWDSQISGIRIPDDVAVALQRLWAEFTGVSPQKVLLPEELPETATYPEGAARQIQVNAYERSPSARRECIDKYGTRCSACDVDLGQVYGEAGVGLIHVHHIQLLSEAGSDYQVDPINDLRPVCPNCHAITHQRNPPYTIAEVRAMLKRLAKRT